MKFCIRHRLLISLDDNAVGGSGVASVVVTMLLLLLLLLLQMFLLWFWFRSSFLLHGCDC